MHKKKSCSIFLILFLILISSSNSYAALLNFSGIYKGGISGNRFGCTLLADNGPFNDFIILSVDQKKNKFIALGSNGKGFKIRVSATIDSSRNFTGVAEFTDGSKASVKGSFSPKDMQIFFKGIVPSSINGCFTNASGKLIKTGGNNIGANILTQQSRQIVRATNSLISQHLATSIVSAFTFIPGKSLANNPVGASADQFNWLPDSLWGTTSLSEIHEDNEAVDDFDTDIYQFVGGFDKQIDRFFIGSAFTYAYAETEQTDLDSISHVFGVTPYGAYQITDFMFISALAGYNFTYVKDETFNTDVDVHDYILESNLNFHKTFFDSIIIKTRIGTRFHKTYVSSTNKPLDATTDELTWLGDFELGYRFENSLTTYVGTYYELTDREESTHQIKEHDGILYMRGGFDYPLSKKIILGCTVQADLTDEDTDIITGSVNIRLAL